MNPLADYRPVVEGRNQIRETPITDTTRVICYNQIIHDDKRIEEDEFFGLSLILRVGTHERTEVDSELNSVLVKIEDNDREFMASLLCE